MNRKHRRALGKANDPQINPNEPIVAHNLAMGLARQNRFSEAVPFHRQAVALNPSNADAQAALAFSLTQLAEYDEAELHYIEALNIDPPHFGARIHLGLALVDQGKIVQAFEPAEILAHAETERGFPHKTFGILLARAGCPDGARLCFVTHLSRHPGDRDEIAMLLATVGGDLPIRATDQQLFQLYALQADRWIRSPLGPVDIRGIGSLLQRWRG
jgi:tetratricopeptide (TPR) repeat protein